MYALQKTILATAISLTSITTWADVVPNAGQLLQQQQIIPYQPQSPVQIESTANPAQTLAGGEQVQVQHIAITGNQSIATEKLHSLVVDSEGKSLTLHELQQLTAKLTAYYQQQGYPYSRAYLPAQNLNNGTVKIVILEAKYDQISIDNHSRTQNSLLEATLAPLQQGKVIEGQQLQQQIKLLNRLNGVHSRNVLRAGQHTGTSQLMVDVQPTALFTGYVGMDNYGNEYTKDARFNAGVAVNNALGWGDKLSVDAMTSGNLNYGKLGYEATLNGLGSRLGFSYSNLSYELGKEYKVLNAEGIARQSSIWLSQPVVLSNRKEVLLTAQYDFKQLEDDIGAAKVYRHRELQVGRLGLNFSQYDAIATGGLNQLGVSTDFGRVAYQDQVAKLADHATARTQGNFYRITGNISRLQNLGSANTQLYTHLQAQYSPDNLDSSEQFSVGGAYSVAGYQNSVLSGSTGYYVLGELRQSLWATGRNQLTGKVYVDSAEVKKQAQTWTGLTGDNRERISSAGLGLNWANAHSWQLQAKVGFPIGSTPASVDQQHDAEAWLGFTSQF